MLKEFVELKKYGVFLKLLLTKDRVMLVL